jgi:histidinol-phosphate aminotransferase
MSSRRDFLKLAGTGVTLLGGAACTGARSGSRAAVKAAGGATPTAQPGVVRIGSNENPFGPGPAALRAIQGNLPEANRYPFRAVGELAEAIAAAQRVDASQVAVACGSSELLEAAVSTFTAADRGLVTAEPTFEAPADHAAGRGAPVVGVRVDANGRLDLDGMLDRSAGSGLVYLCNPNNPTATVHGATAITGFVERLHQRSPDATVLIDEAYHEYVDDPAYRTAIPLALADPRVIVTRTFSKVHGMAGLRVGYAVGQAATIRRLRPWIGSLSMSILGAAAARASLGDAAHIESQRALNRQTRASALDAFRAAGFTAFDSQANFIMVNIRRDARAFGAACLDRGIQIGRPFPPLDQYARISMGTPDEMAHAMRVCLDLLSLPPATATTAELRRFDDAAARAC